MAKYLQTFHVIGKVPFPKDMLRYDNCDFFNDEFKKIAIEKTEHREIIMKRIVNSRSQETFPTISRWNSFLWRVDIASIKYEKIVK